MLLIPLKVFFVVLLVKLLLITDRPPLCAGIYTAGGFVLALAFGVPPVYALIRSAIAFGLAFVYFWLLDRFEESSLFWVILVLGLVIGLV